MSLIICSIWQLVLVAEQPLDFWRNEDDNVNFAFLNITANHVLW